MLTRFASATRHMGRYLLAAPLVLALSYSCSQRVESPLPDGTARQPLKASNALIFIDAQRQDSTALRQLDPEDIAILNVVKGDEARNYDPSASAPGVLIVTTKKNQHRPDVVAFNEKQHLRSAEADILAQKVAKLPADAAYFLDGKASTREGIAALDSKTFTRTDILKGAQAATFAHDEKVQLVVAVSTK
jgi:hypothetical protein